MASIIRVICFRGRAVKCGLRVFSIAMISFMVSLGVNAVLEAVFYLLWPFFFLRYLKITHADWRRYCYESTGLCAGQLYRPVVSCAIRQITALQQSVQREEISDINQRQDGFTRVPELFTGRRSTGDYPSG